MANSMEVSSEYPKALCGNVSLTMGGKRENVGRFVRVTAILAPTPDG